ncbi:MAG: monovalent cation/H+ antiporter subunit D family protein [Deltaproteobacteria bacterium]|nr:monovalent cation/H+ antiporter subunit D family protein [Deltaproteobacteria bacterium]
MEIIESARPLYAIMVSLVSIFPITLSGERNSNLRDGWTVLASVVKFSIVISMLPAVLGGKTIEYTLVTILPGLAVKFRVDSLAVLFAMTASGLWVLTSFYSIGYMRTLEERSQTRFFTYLALAMAATMGLAFSANMFTLFLFYEMITLSTYPLIAHKKTPEAIFGARKYLIYLLGASIAFQLFAIFLTYNIAGTLEFTAGGILAGKGSALLLTVIFVLFLAGIAKAAMMPLHGWLPGAMVAPTPASALLHAVAVVQAGVFAVVRVVYFIFGADLLRELGINTPAAYFASFTIIMASLIALTKDNLKLRLAYSTVSQLSYTIVGALLLTPSSQTGGIFHIVSHAFSKITLFFCAGSIYVSSHRENIGELGGIGRKMPWTMFAFFVGSLSMIGIPPFSGFVSKWYLSVGSVEAENIPILVVFLLSSILNAAYFLPIVYKAFFEEPAYPPLYPDEEIREVPLVVIPLVLSAIGTFVIGLWPGLFIQLAKGVTG